MNNKTTLVEFTNLEKVLTINKVKKDLKPCNECGGRVLFSLLIGGNCFYCHNGLKSPFALKSKQIKSE